MLRIDYIEQNDQDGIFILELVINSDDEKIIERTRRLLKNILAPDAEVSLVHKSPKKD